MSANTQRSPDQTVAIDGNEKNIDFGDDQFCVVAVKAQSVDLWTRILGIFLQIFRYGLCPFYLLFQRAASIKSIATAEVIALGRRIRKFARKEENEGLSNTQTRRPPIQM